MSAFPSNLSEQDWINLQQSCPAVAAKMMAEHVTNAIEKQKQQKVTASPTRMTAAEKLDLYGPVLGPLPAPAGVLPRQSHKDVEPQAVVAVEKKPRYTGATVAPYYNKKSADRITMAIRLFEADKENDVIIPYRVIGLSKATSRTFYAQALNYIQDTPAEFDDIVNSIAPALKVRAQDTGLRISYVAELNMDTIYRAPKESAISAEPELDVSQVAREPKSTVGAPSETKPVAKESNLIANWQSRIEEWLDIAQNGETITLTPVRLSDDDIYVLSSFLKDWGGLSYSVRNEKITIKKLNNFIPAVN